MSFLISVTETLAHSEIPSGGGGVRYLPEPTIKNSPHISLHFRLLESGGGYQKKLMPINSIICIASLITSGPGGGVNPLNPPQCATVQRGQRHAMQSCFENI